MPSAPHRLDHHSSRPASNATTTASAAPKLEDGSHDTVTYSNTHNIKPRKLITVKDPGRDTNVRINAQLDGVNMDEIPDDFRKKNSVYPRSYFPRRIQSPSSSAAFDDDEEAGNGSSNSMLPRGKTLVPIRLIDGWEADFHVPRMSRAKRSKEFALNDLGSKMSWGQTQTFSDRPMFLQRSREWCNAITLRSHADRTQSMPTDSTGRKIQPRTVTPLRHTLKRDLANGSGWTCPDNQSTMKISGSDFDNLNVCLQNCPRLPSRHPVR